MAYNSCIKSLVKGLMDNLASFPDNIKKIINRNAAYEAIEFKSNYVQPSYMLVLDNSAFARRLATKSLRTMWQNGATSQFN